MDKIDEALARLASAPIPPALGGLEARVLARITSQPTTRVGVGMGVITGIALAMGVAGASIPASPGSAASLAPLGTHSPLAPSTLLVGAP